MIFISYILDLILGDPHNLPHPVRLIGSVVSLAEKFIRKLLPKNKKYEIIGGLLLVLLISFLSFTIPFYMLLIAEKINHNLKLIIEIYFCYKLIAVKSLKKESMKVYYSLKENNIENARLMLSYIVGRDTKQLDEKHIINATVETIAENTSDGVVAPIFYMALGGLPLMFLYKAINTMDSMVGYKNKKYLYFGKVAAKTDDIANYIPARIAALFMIAASFICKFDYKNAVRIYKRDRLKHSSPNSAHTEAVCSGALNIMLGGDCYYFGKLYKKNYIGDDIRKCQKEDIVKANKLLYVTSFISVIILSIFHNLI